MTDSLPTDHTPIDQDSQDAPVTAEMLIEEISIDGMCGVY